MKNIAKILAVIACTAAIALPAAAQEKRSSISAFGNYSKFSKDKDASGIATVNYGYLLSPQFEIGISVSEIFGAASLTGVGGSAQYYLDPVGKPQQFNPYGKVDVFSFSGSGLSSTQTGVYIGASYSVTESTEAFIEVGAQNRSQDSGGKTFTDDGTIVQFGLKLRF